MGLRYHLMADSIGQRCTTNEHFTSELARALELPHLIRTPDESDRAWLIRRVDQLKWISRHWHATDLSLLDDEALSLAASQICNACADYCQDKVAERLNRARLARERSEMTDKVMVPPYSMACMAMVLFGLSSLLDSGSADDVTLDDVKAHAHAGDLIEFLTEKAGGVFASGVLEGPSWAPFRKWYVEQIRDHCRAMDGRERRKYGVTHRGVCLLVSYTAEILQQATNKELNLDRKMYSESDS
jgi:AcrR family transcriptional regulator